MLAAYRDRGDLGMVRALETAPVSMTDGTPPAYLQVRDKAMHRLGIGTTHDVGSVITGIFLPSWRSLNTLSGRSSACGAGERSPGASGSGSNHPR